MYQLFIKGLLDKSLAVLILLVTSPIAIVIAILIKLESDGPVLFNQMRTGRGGKEFKLHKFRSMTCNNDVRDLSKKNETTRIGKVLRTLSLDEIPQLINVLRGEMSFIGPRPWIPEYFEHMTKRQRQRTDVLPGITGLAQVDGRNRLTINQKINRDLEYVKDVSFKKDLRIVLLTVKTILDKGGQEIAKSGIHNELETLKNQMRSNSQKEEANTSNNESYS